MYDLLVPANRKVVGRGQENVQVAIRVHIGRHHPAGTIRSLGDHMFDERTSPVVLVPGNRIVLRRRGEQIHVTITVRIGHENRACLA